MKKHMAALGALALAAGMPAAALADGWTTIDLGNVPTEAGCVDRAQRMFNTFGEYYSVIVDDPGSWSVAAYDLTHEDFDALVSCAYGPNDNTRGTLVVHSTGAAPDAKRREIARSLDEIWKAQ